MSKTSNKKAEYILTVKGVDSDGKPKNYTCSLCKPNRYVIGAALSEATPLPGREPKLIEAGEIILNSCWVDGDQEIKDDDEMFVAACLQSYEMIKIAETTLKKI